MKYLFLVFAATFLFFAVSCATVKYEGDILPAVPDEEPIVFITDVRTRPDAERVLGYAELDAAPAMKSNEIKDALRKRARKVGANVIRIVTMKKIPDGEARMDQRYNSSQSALNWNTQGSGAPATDNLRERLTSAGDNSTPGLVTGFLSGSSQFSDDKAVYRTYIRAEFRALRDL